MLPTISLPSFKLIYQTRNQIFGFFKRAFRIEDISKDFYNAARSMGASTLDIIKDIVLPGSLPGVLTGLRLAIGLGWMSVI